MASVHDGNVKECEREDSRKSTDSMKSHIGGIETNRVFQNIWTQTLHSISVNPFINIWDYSTIEKLRFYTIGLFMIVIRLVPILLIGLFACIFGKICVIIIALLQQIGIDTEPFRVVARDICFAILRASFFFGGFYWIRIVDHRLDKSRFAPIIPVAPHSSFFDFLVILKLKRPTFVSRLDNKDIPFVGNILKLCKGIYVDRDDKNSRANTISEIKKRAQNGEHILIFPEGTCANRTSMVQYKQGAFIPGLPVQPVIVRWEAGVEDSMDSVTWSWEGPGPLRLLLHALARTSTNLEINILPEYVPNEEERTHIKVFSANVSRMMCYKLGVLQSYYSFDDVPLIPLARNIGMFRSPICMFFLKIAYKLEEITSKTKKSVPAVPDSKGNGSIATLNAHIENILSVGEDAEHGPISAEHYVPLNYHGHVSSQKSAPNTATLVAFRRDTSYGTKEFEYLNVSGARRRIFSTHSCPTLHKLTNQRDIKVHELFCRLIENCLTNLESNFELRPIKSANDIIELLCLEQIASKEEIDLLRTKVNFVDLLTMLEFSLPIPVSTIHLLIALHLVDVREYDSWTRIETAIRLFDMVREASTNTVNTNNDNSLPWINLIELRTLLWYCLGLQEFNDEFFIDRQFDIRLIHDLLTCTFRRATVENGPQLLI